MSLEIVYIVVAFIIISLLLLMAFLFKRRTKKQTLTNNINKKDIVKYLLKNYPKINFDVSILGDTSFTDIQKEKIAVIENLVTQFANIKTEFPNTASMIDHEFIWETYQINSKPLKGKMPPDLSRRKDALLFRDKHTCQRCSFDINKDNMRIYFLRSIEDGGDYSFENMLSVCNDCHRILHSNEIKKTIHELDLTEKLFTIA